MKVAINVKPYANGNKKYFAFELAGQKRTRCDFAVQKKAFGQISYEMQTPANGKIASLSCLPANSNAKQFKCVIV
jgi:hypothetical protein